MCEKECKTKNDNSGAVTDDDTSDSSVSDSNNDSDSDTISDDGEAIVVMLPDQPRNKGPQVRKKYLLIDTESICSSTQKDSERQTELRDGERISS